MEFKAKVICDHRVGSPVTAYVQGKCPKCKGKGTYGGVQYDNQGQVLKVSNVETLKQKIEKILIEDRRPTGYGFDYSLFRGYVIDDSTISAAKAEVIRCISYIRFIQQNEIRNGYFYTPSEELVGIKNITTSIDSLDPRKLVISVILRAKSGATPTVQTSLNL